MNLDGRVGVAGVLGKVDKMPVGGGYDDTTRRGNIFYFLIYIFSF
jgi:hypothetical protein